MANADCIIIQGSNMAECHPVGFQWVSEAKARGARIIHIDPRFTRTAAHATDYVRFRSGTDIAVMEVQQEPRVLLSGFSKWLPLLKKDNS